MVPSAAWPSRVRRRSAAVNREAGNTAIGTITSTSMDSFHDKNSATPTSTTICSESRSQLATVYVAACSTAATSDVKRLSKSPDNCAERCIGESRSSFSKIRRRRSTTTCCPKSPTK
jgi:hypothetical protein